MIPPRAILLFAILAATAAVQLIFALLLSFAFLI